LALEDQPTMLAQAPPGRPLAAALATRFGGQATPVQIATAFGTLVLEINTAMSPIVGPRGVAALGQRSLHLAAAQHPWLAAHPNAAWSALDDVRLLPLIGQRSLAEARAAVGCLLQTFWDLLASLIGSSLTERLLRPVWGPVSAPVPLPGLTIAPAQEPLP
jgi:hypothetical protein